MALRSTYFCYMFCRLRPGGGEYRLVWLTVPRFATGVRDGVGFQSEAADLELHHQLLLALGAGSLRPAPPRRQQGGKCSTVVVSASTPSPVWPGTAGIRASLVGASLRHAARSLAAVVVTAGAPEPGPAPPAACGPGRGPGRAVRACCASGPPHRRASGLINLVHLSSPVRPRHRVDSGLGCRLRGPAATGHQAARLAGLRRVPRYNWWAMYLLSVRVSGVGPFEHVLFPFADEEGEPRLLTVLHGGGGVGKTTLVGAIAATRPGHAIVPQRELTRGVAHERPPVVVCEWRLGQDDPERPHPLLVATPTARLSEDDDREAFRRRGGYVFVAIPATRWFSRQPISLSAPARTVASYDVRGAASLDDGSRTDLARETKQALAYAGISAALASTLGHPEPRFARLGQAMQSAVTTLAKLAGFSYIGIDPYSLEPQFQAENNRIVPFDALPTRARHLVAFAVLPLRALGAAYPDSDPRTAEGVVVIDEADMYQDPNVQAALPAALRQALPGVQWIVSTTSPKMAGSCDTREVLALRRIPERGCVELFVGSEARTH
jgi:hypothetical protein